MRILHGQVSTVIAGWRAPSDMQGPDGSKEENAAGGLSAFFLAKNKRRMRYDEYLRLGCPVATGVIEGACRHVIKDRMERAGMRWKVPGAQAMLNLRTIYTNGDWTAFQDFRTCLGEPTELYPNTNALAKLENGLLSKPRSLSALAGTIGHTHLSSDIFLLRRNPLSSFWYVEFYRRFGFVGFAGKTRRFLGCHRNPSLILKGRRECTGLPRSLPGS